MLTVTTVTDGKNPNSFRLCLEGFSRQTTKDFYQVVVDDGGPNQDLYRSIVNEYSTKINIKYLYVDPPRPSNICRTTAALNLAFRYAKGDRILNVFGDSIPSMTLVEENSQYGSEPVMVAGMRKGIPQEVAENLTVDDFHKLDVYVSNVDIRLPNILRYHNQRLETNWPAYAYNISYPLKQMFLVGGYNEEWLKYNCYGHEDLQVAARLVNLRLS